jgi:hypothetical protein
MSAKADMAIALQMSANDPKQTTSTRQDFYFVAAVI